MKSHWELAVVSVLLIGFCGFRNSSDDLGSFLHSAPNSRNGKHLSQDLQSGTCDRTVQVEPNLGLRATQWWWGRPQVCYPHSWVRFSLRNAVEQVDALDERAQGRRNGAAPG